MRIHGMCVVKNESDIIEQTLNAAKKWCDFIYVYDNGSTDGTWETILSMTERCKEIIPFKQDAKPFTDEMRFEIYEAYRSNARPYDWWCILDADEFYIDNPRIFLRLVPRYFEVVWSASLEYYFTDVNMQEYEAEPARYADHVPVEEKCRYYISNWSERRFFRTDCVKKGLSSLVSCPVRIRLRHYQYRSPQQIQKRLETRRPAMMRKLFRHETLPDWRGSILHANMIKFRREKSTLPVSWRERVVEAAKLNYDRHDGNYVVDERLMPKIHTPDIGLWCRLGLARLALARAVGVC